MTDIRLLEHYEVPLLVPQAREFFKEGLIIGALNEPHFVKTLTALTLTGGAVTLVSGAPFRGAICGLLSPDPATADLNCMEYFWYVAREERGTLGIRLLDAFESHMSSIGVKNILMMHHVALHKEKFERIYEKRGYRLHEQIFVKELQR